MFMIFINNRGEIESMKNIKIRWAVYDDAEDLGIIHSQGWKTAYKSIIPDKVLARITAQERKMRFEAAIKDNTQETAVLTIDNKVIGFCTLGPNRDEDLDDSYGEIWGIYLLPQYLSRGLGKVLINWAIKELAQRGYDKISLWVLEDNINARNFYEKIGFMFDGTVKKIEIGIQLNEVRYIKKYLKS